MFTRIGIVGAGAIGAIVGGRLTRAGVDVTLLEQWPEHVEAIRRQGLRLSGPEGEDTVKVRALHLHEAQALSEPFDAVFIAVKSYDTEWATQLGIRYLETRSLTEVEADVSRDARSRGGGRPSMLQDVMRGRRTEIDYLNGYVVEQGKAVGVAAPFNETIVRLFHEYGVRLTPDRRNLELLLRLLP